jgi:hypothetical protein
MWIFYYRINSDSLIKLWLGVNTSCRCCGCAVLHIGGPESLRVQRCDLLVCFWVAGAGG